MKSFSKILAAALFLACYSGGAFALPDDGNSGDVKTSRTHAMLESSHPGNNEKLIDSPKEIVLRFSEEMDPRQSSIIVYTLTGNRMNDGRVTPTAMGKTTVAAVLGKPLPKGRYIVRWRVGCLMPGHLPVEGSFNFAIE